MEEGECSEGEKKSRVVTIVRVRPVVSGEDERQSIAVRNETTLEIQANGVKRIERVELALGPSTTQRQVFEMVEPLLAKAAEGFNVSLLTYGQTGSGKTHTMFGSDWNNIIKEGGQGGKTLQSTFIRSIEQDENHAGLIPRCIYLLFDRLIAKRRKHIKIYCSFMQLYNEQLSDLLEDDPKAASKQKLLIHESKQDGIYVEGINEVVVEDADQCLQLMRRGERNRVVRQTYMNAKSSRSHTVFALLVEEVFPSKKSYRRMKINLCDLAGSEKMQKTESITGTHFEELKNINLSLTTLGKVISALASGKAIPPYRESKLTRLLQDSLGGNTSTAVIATITSRSSCVEESLNTLKFLERARQVKGEIVAKVYSDNPDMRNLQRQIAYLRDMLKMRGGQVPTDIQMRDRFKQLQHQNQKLKEMVDQGLVQKLKKENVHLKQQILNKSNDVLSDSFIQQLPHFRTVEQDDAPSQQGLHSISSTGNTNKFPKSRRQPISRKEEYLRKDDARSLAAKTDDASIKGSTFQRGTGVSIFPSLNRGGPKATNKILDRILQIQRAKQQNRVRLEKQLQLLDKRASMERQEPKGHSRTLKKQ